MLRHNRLYHDAGHGISIYRLIPVVFALLPLPMSPFQMTSRPADFLATAAAVLALCCFLRIVQSRCGAGNGVYALLALSLFLAGSAWRYPYWWVHRCSLAVLHLSIIGNGATVGYACPASRHERSDGDEWIAGGGGHGHSCRREISIEFQRDLRAYLFIIPLSPKGMLML